jgi:hypothetical protein
MEDGQATTITPANRVFSLQDVADFLGVSTKYILRQLQDAISC